MRLLTCCLLLCLVAACSDDNKKEVLLEGERIEVLDRENGLEPDESAEGETISIPSFSVNNVWEQVGGGVVNNQGNLAIRTTEVADSVTVGKGYDWSSHLVAQPIIAEDTIFAMDGRGYISAHVLKDISTKKWVSDTLAANDEAPLIGGGMAYLDGVVYATSGRGWIAALDAKSGKQLWRLAQGIPIRAAPRVVNGWLIAVTVDNQTLAVNAKTGRVIWTHRGISETAGFLANIAPAIVGESVVVPYSSGELIALDIATGTQRWMDMIVSERKTSALSRFTGITALPIVHEGAVYSLHASGMLAAHIAENGASLWERRMTSYHTPWIVGDYMVVVTNDDELALLRHRSGEIVWVKQLEKEEKETRWLDPVVAGNHIQLGNSAGEMRVYDHQNGELVTQYDIPSNAVSMPIVAQGGMYFLTQDATLYGLY